MGEFGSRGGSFASDFFNEAKNYINLLSDANINTISSLKNGYLETINLSKTNIDTLKYSNWKDNISTKLKGFTDNLKDNKFPDIETDIGTGNGNLLSNELLNLRLECQKYIDEENRTIHLNFRNKNDETEYNNNNNSNKLSATGKEDLRIYNNNVNNRKTNLINIEANARKIIEKISSITFMGSNGEEDNSEIINNPSNIPAGWIEAGDFYLVPDFQYVDEFDRTIDCKMLFDVNTGNRVIEMDDQKILIKKDKDGYQREWYIKTDAPLNSEIVHELLKTNFEDMKSGIFERSITAYGQNNELSPGRNSNWFSNSEINNYVINVGGVETTVTTFTNDPTTQFLINNGAKIIER